MADSRFIAGLYRKATLAYDTSLAVAALDLAAVVSLTHDTAELARAMGFTWDRCEKARNAYHAENTRIRLLGYERARRSPQALKLERVRREIAKEQEGSDWRDAHGLNDE